ncbi:RING finger protein 112 isoform X2 [Canis lupus familiaris]|nr:RING finger protein 112 isoform X2 [Canis lupus familiaris]XP_038392981.1 RING finger protein 112 isoform X2 [Canis lupus familiaris]XP_038521683.1 RING finger protein 112 isoform X2 [Canis lupus familiaris]
MSEKSGGLGKAGWRGCAGPRAICWHPGAPLAAGVQQNVPPGKGGRLPAPLQVSSGGAVLRLPHLSCTPCRWPWEDPGWASRDSACPWFRLCPAPIRLLSLHPSSPSLSLSFPSVSMATHHLGCLHPSLCQGFWAWLGPSLLRSPGSRSPVSSPWGESRGSLLFPDCHIYFPALTSLGRLLWGDHPPPPPPATAQPALPGGKPSLLQPSVPARASSCLCLQTSPHSQPPMPRSALSIISFCHRLGKQERKRSFMGSSRNSWSHTPFPKLELGLGSRPAVPRELPACSICLERLREPISLDCGHDFCTRCFSTHRVPGCEPPCCPECRKICKQKRGLRSLGEKMKLLPQRPLPAVLQETCAVRAEPLLLVRINASGGLILRMGAINRCLKHPLARDTPVCLLAVLGEQHSGKTFLLNHLLRGLPSLESGEGGWPRGGSLQGFRWGANSLTRGIWMWSHPFLLGKEGRKVAVFLVDTGDAMSPELSRETRTKLCALTTMLSSYQILNTSPELKDTDLEYLEMFVHVAEVMGRHYGMVPIQHLDLLVRDSSYSSKAGLGRVGDMIQKSSGKYPKVQELLQGRRARCYLLPTPARQWATRGQGSPGDTDDDLGHLSAYVADVLSAAPQHAKSRCQGYWSEGRPVARGDRRLLTGQQLAQEIKNLSGWMGRTGPGFASADEMAAQLHDLRTVEAAKKEFEEYVRQQDVATKRIFSALRVLPDTMRNLLSTQKDAILARHGAALLCQGREQTLEALEAELQAEAKVFMDSYTMRFCGHLAAVGGAVGAGLMGLAGGVVGAGMAAAALAAEAGMVAAGAAVGATGAAVVGGGVGAGLAATVGCMEKEEDDRVQEGDREPLLQEE